MVSDTPFRKWRDIYFFLGGGGGARGFYPRFAMFFFNVFIST